MKPVKVPTTSSDNATCAALAPEPAEADEVFDDRDSTKSTGAYRENYKMKSRRLAQKCPISLVMATSSQIFILYERCKDIPALWLKLVP